MVQDYKYNEPSALDKIKGLRQKHPVKKIRLSKKTLQNKTQGAWFGRICGDYFGYINPQNPSKWIQPLNNTLETTIFGYDKVKITDCVKITLEHTK